MKVEHLPVRFVLLFISCRLLQYFTMSKRRAQHWSEDEELVLTNSVLDREGTLFAKLKGDRVEGLGVTAEEKAKAWREVLDAMNAYE